MSAPSRVRNLCSSQNFVHEARNEEAMEPARLAYGEASNVIDQFANTIKVITGSIIATARKGGVAFHTILIVLIKGNVISLQGMDKSCLVQICIEDKHDDSCTCVLNLLDATI